MSLRTYCVPEALVLHQILSGVVDAEETANFVPAGRTTAEDKVLRICGKQGWRYREDVRPVARHPTKAIDVIDGVITANHGGVVVTQVDKDAQHRLGPHDERLRRKGGRNRCNGIHEACWSELRADEAPIELSSPKSSADGEVRIVPRCVLMPPEPQKLSRVHRMGRKHTLLDIGCPGEACSLSQVFLSKWRVGTLEDVV